MEKWQDKAVSGQLAAMVTAATIISNTDEDVARALGLLFVVGEELDHVGMIVRGLQELWVQFLIDFRRQTNLVSFQTTCWLGNQQSWSLELFRKELWRFILGLSEMFNFSSFYIEKLSFHTFNRFLLQFWIEFDSFSTKNLKISSPPLFFAENLKINDF